MILRFRIYVLRKKIQLSREGAIRYFKHLIVFMEYTIPKSDLFYCGNLTRSVSGAISEQAPERSKPLLAE
jgi:hypothetical protein